MTGTNKSPEELLADNEDLRIRLEEAEDTLRAIGSGEVDAFVVSGPEGEQVFTLKGAEQPYRVLVETMNEGAVTLDADGTIIFCNSRLAAMLQVPQERLIGTQLVSYVAPADRLLFSARLGKCHEECDKDEIAMITGAGNYVPVMISCCAFDLSGNRQISVVVTDLSEQKRNEEIMASEKLARSIIEQAGEALIVCDEGGRIIRASRLAHQICGENPLLKPFNELFHLRIMDADCFLSIMTPLLGGCFENIEVEFNRGDGQIFHLILNATPLKSAENLIIGCIVTLTDFTERKQAERDLLQSEARLQAAYNQLEETNDKLQLQSEELQAQSEELQTQSEELQAQNHELTRLWEETSRAEETLRESEERFRAIFELSSVGKAQADPSTGRFLLVNDHFCEITGYTREEMLHMTFEDITHPEDLAHNREIYGKAKKREISAWTTEMRYLRKDGSVAWVEVNGTMLFNHKGYPTSSIAAIIEITGRKQSEQAMRESEERLALALEGGRMGLWEWDTRNNRSVWNTIEYELLGVPVGEGVEATDQFFDRVHPEDLGPFNQILNDVMKNGGDFQHEMRIIRADDGQERWLAAAGRLFRDAAGQPMKMIGVNYDITGRKLAEEALNKLKEDLENRVVERTAELAVNIEKLKLETSERLQAVEALREKEQILIQQSRQAALGEMIGNIAHQWRQPLNTLGLTIQQLLLFYDLNDFDREFLEKGVTNSMELIQHMSRTIDDFRNYFKPDKEKAEFKVREAIENTLSLMEGSLKNPQISIDIVEKDNPVIYGYRNEFAQTLLNILTNARDALVEREVDDPRVTITIKDEDGSAVVTVADNAGGIPEEIIGRIFDPYFTTKGPQMGTGVGLFMSKTIIEKNMGGRLSARNTGTGAEFRIEV